MTKMSIIEVHLKHLLNLGYAEWIQKKELKSYFINVYEYAFEFLREEYLVNTEISSDVCNPTYYEAVYYVRNFLSDMELYKLEGYRDENGNFKQFTDIYHLKKHLLDSCIQLVEGTLSSQFD